MADDKPISDNQVSDRIAAARDVLGSAPGSTIEGDTAIKTARTALEMLSFGLLAAGEKKARASDPLAPSDPQSRG